MLELGGDRHSVGPIGPHNVVETHFARHTIGRLEQQAIARGLVVEGGESFAELPITRVQRVTLGGDVGQRRAAGHTGQFELASLEPQTLKPVVDGTHLVLFDVRDVFAQPFAARHTFTNLGPWTAFDAERLLTFAYAAHIAVEIAPLATLDDDRLARVLDGIEIGVVEPLEINAGQVAIANLEQQTIDRLLALGHGHTVIDEARRGDRFLVHHFTERIAHVAASQVQARDIRGPEMAHAAHCDQQQQTEHHDQREAHRTGRQPHARRAGMQPLA